MTALELANYALSRIGARNITSFTDTNSPHSVMVGLFLTHFRDEILRITTWPFAMKRTQLLEIDSGQDVAAWVTLTAYAAGAQVLSRGHLFECITGGTTGATAPSTTSLDITDGTVHWEYQDDVLAWTTLTPVLAGAQMVASGGLYICITAGTTGATIPTALTADVTDGSAHWRFVRLVDENHTDFSYRYPFPSDCIRIKEVDDGADYVAEYQIIYTDGNGILRYVHRLEDISLWDPVACDALILRLAAAIAPNITGKERPDLLQEFSAISSLAIKAGKGEATRGTPAASLFVDVG